MSESDGEIPGAVAWLDIYHLHIRHPGMAREITDNYAVNAAVCMSRHHLPPHVWHVGLDQHEVQAYQVNWALPTVEQLRSCANDDDATRDGAYGMALAAADIHLGLVALRRAEGRSGVDFYLVLEGAEIPTSPDIDVDHEGLVGLEVSGIDDDNDTRIRTRVRQKLRQALEGRSPHPAIVAIVGFQSASILFRTVRE